MRGLLWQRLQDPFCGATCLGIQGLLVFLFQKESFGELNNKAEGAGVGWGGGLLYRAKPNVRESSAFPCLPLQLAVVAVCLTSLVISGEEGDLLLL